MARPKSYRDLIVWQKAMALARETYLLTGSLPRNEGLGLLAQVRRAAVSVPSNIAEGHGRLTDSQFRHFLGNARGSLSELQTQIELATDLGFLNQGKSRELTNRAGEVARLIDALITTLGKPPKSREQSMPGGARADAANSANSASSARE